MAFQDLNKYTVKQLKEIIQLYNLHYQIKGYKKLRKHELITHINKFFGIYPNNYMFVKLKNIKI
jgi:hypothetical protein